MQTTKTNMHSNEADGAAWAAILASAIGCASFGLLTDAAQMSKAISAKLNFSNPVGDLSGKSTLAIMVWIVSWIILNQLWKHRFIHRPGRVLLISAVLILFAIIATFPPVFELLPKY